MKIPFSNWRVSVNRDTMCSICHSYPDHPLLSLWLDVSNPVFTDAAVLDFFYTSNGESTLPLEKDYHAG